MLHGYRWMFIVCVKRKLHPIFIIDPYGIEARLISAKGFEIQRFELKERLFSWSGFQHFYPFLIPFHYIRLKDYPLSISLKADYYIGRFNFSAYWESRNSYVDGETCFLRRFPQEYMVEAGWSHKGWNLQLTVANIFNSGWTLSHDSFRSRWFDSRRILTGSTYHRRIALTVAYRFGYGRKLSTGNELESSGSISTSILR